MIFISEETTKKMPGETSLFIRFDYNQRIVDIIKQIQNAQFHKDIRAWEIPLTLLSDVLDRLCVLDEIKFTWKNQKPEKEPVKYELMPYKTHLFDYQEDGVQFGLNHEKFLLLDAPGLGKSLEIICIAQELKARKDIKHCLVICGINTLKTNWKSEIQKHSDLSCRILGERITKKGRHYIGTVNDRIADLKQPIDEFFIITNIETLRNDDIIKELNKNTVNPIDMIVLDECHVCKDPNSTQGKHLLKLTKAKYKIAATGTLLLNNPCDCYVPLKWIDEERSTFSNFKYYYCVYGGDFGNDLIGYKNTKYLKEQLSRVSLRRTKDILNLPPKTVIEEYVDMSESQEEFYNNIKNGIIEQVDKVDLNPASVLAMITRLRQATACPSILTSENISSAKLDRASDLAEQICSDPQQKLVIFSTFKESANQLYQRLSKYNPVLCTGDIGDMQIEDNKQKFQNDDKYQIFIATWQKCGTGITLTRASTSIFIDVPWTQANFCQAQDRIYRIGSKNPVFIYHLITRDTVDEKVRQIVEDKALIGEYIIDDKITPQLANRLKEIIVDLQ